jgi:hypothetical protein
LKSAHGGINDFKNAILRKFSISNIFPFLVVKPMQCPYTYRVDHKVGQFFFF